MKVLVTGNMGYIGPALQKVLLASYPNLEIIGYDTAFFGQSLTDTACIPEIGLVCQYYGDIREITPPLFEGVDAVVHLAAISNDPMGVEFENVTAEINQNASVQCALMAAKAGVKNFVFASSCSVYGQADGRARNENDPLNPLTAYARSKIGTENLIQEHDIGGMIFTSLRFATACGWSSRLRLDLVLNDFVASAIASGKINILSDGTPWRPLIDIGDMSRAIAWAISRSADNGGRFLAVNVGSNKANYQVRDLAEAVSQVISGVSISINKDAQPDRRSYSVDFSLFESLAPGYQPVMTLTNSIESLRDGLLRMKFSNLNFRDSSYIRLNTLRDHISSGRLNQNLRWNKSFVLGRKPN